MTTALAPCRDWRARAACHRQNPDLWDDRTPDQGKRFCRESCPVLDQCLRTALASEGAAISGRSWVHGGLTGPERDDFHADRQHPDAADWDTDQARLIALEAAAGGESVETIAERDGAGFLTACLAARLLGRTPEPAAVAGRRLATEQREEIQAMLNKRCSLPTMARRLGVPVSALRVALDRIAADRPDPQPAQIDVLLERREELLALRRAGMTIAECADRMRFSRHVVKHALRKIREEGRAAGATAAAMDLELAS